MILRDLVALAFANKIIDVCGDLVRLVLCNVKFVAGIGGTIDVVTRKPLDLKPFETYLSAQGAYTELSDKFDPQFSGLVSWKNEGGTFGAMLAAVYQKRNIRRDGVEVLGYQDTDPTAGTLLAPSLIGSALFQQERIRKGGNFTLQFAPTEQWDLTRTGRPGRS